MRTLIALLFAALIPTLAHADGIKSAELERAVADDCGFCDGLCLDGECYMNIPPSQMTLAQTEGCPDDPCGGLCLAGICYEIRPVIASPEPVTDTPDAALIHWEGCPEIPCGGLCLAGLCYEIRPLIAVEEPVVCEAR